MTVIIIPHGFQNHYTIGFTNGLALNGIDACLITYDELDEKQLHFNIECNNLRRSTSESRTTMECYRRRKLDPLAIVKWTHP